MKQYDLDYTCFLPPKLANHILYLQNKNVDFIDLSDINWLDHTKSPKHMFNASISL